MSSIGDERVAFYLANRELIEEWAQLKVEAVEAFVAMFQQLEPRVAEIGDYVAALDQPLPFYLLSLPAWREAGQSDRAVGVCLELSRRALFTGRIVPYIYVGVRTVPESPVHERVARAFKSEMPSPERADGHWPWWRYVEPPEGAWWEDRERYEELLVQALRETWEQMELFLNRVLREPGEA